MEKNLEKNELNHFAVYMKLTQHCKSTILQFKKNKKYIYSSTQFYDSSIVPFLSLCVF